MRGVNKTWIHFIITETNDDGETEKKYFTTAKKVSEYYDISRPTIYRLLKEPDANTFFTHKIERVKIHTSALEHLR